jgi:hypothetical protein
MPWLEKSMRGGVAVVVLEARGPLLWQRYASDPRAGRGKTTLKAEHATAVEAKRALAASVATLVADGYIVIDRRAGVDAFHPRGRAPLVDRRLSAEDLPRTLRTALRAVEPQPTVGAVVAAFDAVMRLPRSFRARAYLWSVSPSGAITVGLRLATKGDPTAGFQISTVADAIDGPASPSPALAERITSTGESWAVFDRRLRLRPTWTAVVGKPAIHYEFVNDIE